VPAYDVNRVLLLLLFIVSQRLVRPVSPPVTFLNLDWLDDWLDVVGQDGAVGGATLGFDVFRRSGHNFRTGSHEQLQTGRPVLILKGLLDGRLSLLADVQFLPDGRNGHDG
jgi:hypothetical protein